MPVVSKPCVDCAKEGILTKRKTTGKPALCATHRRARRSKRSAYTHDKHIMETYGISSEEYWLIYEAQGGVCYICRRARGIKKKLSVDHCHSTGQVRGLLCTMCNKYILGHLRDDVEAAQRVIDYLLHPPALDVIGIRITPDVAALTGSQEEVDAGHGANHDYVE